MRAGHETESSTTMPPVTLVKNERTYTKALDGLQLPLPEKQTYQSLPRPLSRVYCQNSGMEDSWQPGILGTELSPRLKRRSGWFWVTTCLVSMLLVLGSPRLTPASFSLAQLTHTLRSHSGTSVEVRTSKPDFDAPTTPGRQLARTDDVQFDNFSLILKGQRVFLQ